MILFSDFIQDSIKRLKENDPSLVELNLNNIKTMSAEVIQRLCEAMIENTNLLKLHMAATCLTNSMIEPMFDMLERNHTLKLLNLESNFITGTLVLRHRLDMELTICLNLI